MGVVHNVVAEVKKHPYAFGGGAGLLVLLLLMRHSSSAAPTVDPATQLALARLSANEQEALAKDQVDAASNPSMYAAQAAEEQAKASEQAAAAGYASQNQGFAAQLKAALAATAASVTNTANTNKTQLSIVASNNATTQADATAADAVQSQSIAATLQQALASITGSVTIAGYQTNSADQIAGDNVAIDASNNSTALQSLQAQLAGALAQLQTSILGTIQIGQAAADDVNKVNDNSTANSISILGQQTNDATVLDAANAEYTQSNFNNAIHGFEDLFGHVADETQIITNNATLNNIESQQNNTAYNPNLAATAQSSFQAFLQSLGIQNVLGSVAA